MIRKQPKLPTESDFQVLWRNAWLVLLASAHGLACFLFPWSVALAGNGDPLRVCVCMVLLGVIASQLVILAFLLAFFPAGLVMRLSLVVGCVAVSICLMLVGNLQTDGTVTVWLDMYLCWVPILIAGWAIPFFAAKAFFGWSLHFCHDHELEDSKMTVSSMMVGTTLIACCLALLNTGSEIRVAPALAVSIACIGFGLVFAIPITLTVLSENRLLIKVIKCQAISMAPAAALLGGFFATGSRDATAVFATIALVCLLLSYCCFLIGIRMLGLNFSTTARLAGERNASGVNGVDEMGQSS